MRGFVGAGRAIETGWPMRLRPQGRHAGFTLVEVLVAVAIVSVALAAGVRATGALVDNTRRFADVTAAQWCAENRLTGLRLARQYPDVGSSEFACAQRGIDYRGVMRVSPTPNNPNFRRVDVVMADLDGRPVITLSTVMPRNP